MAHSNVTTTCELGILEEVASATDEVRFRTPVESIGFREIGESALATKNRRFLAPLGMTGGGLRLYWWAEGPRNASSAQSQIENPKSKMPWRQPEKALDTCQAKLLDGPRDR